MNVIFLFLKILKLWICLLLAALNNVYLSNAGERTSLQKAKEQMRFSSQKMHENTFKKLLKRFLKSYSKIKCFRNLSNPFKQTKVVMNKKTLCSLPITKLRLRKKV